MDGKNNGSKPYEQMDDLEVFPLFLETPICNLPPFSEGFFVHQYLTILLYPQTMTTGIFIYHSYCTIQKSNKDVG